MTTSFYLRLNVLLLGNSQLYRGDQINVNGLEKNSNIYVKRDLFHLADTKKTQRSVQVAKAATV